jgi:hypothetical protein
MNAFCCASSGVLDPEELETLSIRIVDNGGYTTGGGELRSVPSQPAGPERNNGIDECAVRKSLAWDGAFFTSSGTVLDDLEVSVEAPYINQCLFLL